jgi:hypothetical protein
MDRTIFSFRIALAMEKDDWKPFRNALDKKDSKKFDEMMFGIPRLYISQLALFYYTAHKAPYLILMSILMYDYHHLVESISQVEYMTSKVECLQKLVNSPSQSKLLDFKTQKHKHQRSSLFSILIRSTT